jgi:hypothetical protein
MKKMYYFREDVGISNDDSNNEGDKNECIFLTLEKKIVSTNHERCAKESGPKIYEEEKESSLDKDYWVIESGFSNHMTRDKINFAKIENYDGGLFIFGDDSSKKIVGKGTIIFYGKNSIDGLYYLNGLRHSIRSVGKIFRKGYNIVFQD